MSTEQNQRYRPTRRAKRYTASFGGAAVLLLLLALTQFPWYGAMLVSWIALAFGGVALAYGLLGARAFGKRMNGTLPPWSLLLFGPYYAQNFLTLALWRRLGREQPFHEIELNLFLGCRLFGSDEVHWRTREPVAVLDATAEFSEVAFLRQGERYLCLPVLDTQPPTIAQLDAGIEWIARHIDSRPVYVHCALGHGRSATFVVAYLLRQRGIATVSEAVAFVAAVRPDIGLSESQHARLEEWLGASPA